MKTEVVLVVVVVIMALNAVHASRPKRYVVTTQQRNKAPDSSEPRVSIYPVPDWMQRIIHPNDFEEGEQNWLKQERRCSAATALADDICDGLLQVLPEKQPLRLFPQNITITIEERRANVKVLPHGNFTNGGFQNKGVKYRFWEEPSEPNTDLLFHHANGEVEARIAGTYLIVSQITFNSLGMKACYHIKSSHRHRDTTKITLLTSALYREASNRFNSCVAECQEVYTFRAQMSVSATVLVRLRAGERVWLEACYPSARNALIVLKPNLTHLTVLRI